MPSQINFNPLRAFGSNGHPSPGALAYFYETGTSTPLTVYTDDSLATAHPTPLVANAQGVFAPVFVDGATAAKVNVTTSAGAALAGYPIDPVQLVSSTGSAASQVSFAPITGNSATDVQGAIQNLTTLWNAVTTYGKSLIAAIDAPAARTVLGLGTAATRAAEDTLSNGSSLPDGAAVTAYVTGYGTKSLSGSGHAALPGGLIVQWGSITVAADATGAISWPRSFPNNAFQAVASLGGDFDFTGDAGCAIYGLTKTGATVRNGAGSTLAIRYIAVGN